MPEQAMKLTDTQRQILLALCRPCIGESRYVTPATNQQIAGEVFLSVDAVKAHLRALYRKFGVEPLPHNQKRARLVELVLESGLLAEELEAAGGDGGGGVGAPPAPPVEAEPEAAAPPPAPPPPAPPERGAPRRRSLLVGAALALGGVAVVLALAGVFSGDSGEEASGETLSKAEYVAAVNRACADTTARAGAIGPGSGATRAERADDYLLLMDALSGRLASVPPPAEASGALERFRLGLTRAADLTSEVRQAPPRPGSRESTRIVAELTIAAGQIQAGAVGYGLGAECSAVADLIAGSARNAAGTP
jgi:hypothetical protein